MKISFWPEVALPISAHGSSLCSIPSRLFIYSTSADEPETTWKNENLVLLTDEEYWKEIGLEGDDIALVDMAEKEQMLGVFRNDLASLVNVGGKCPTVTHMFLYQRGQTG